MRHRNIPTPKYEDYSSSSSTSPTTRQRGFERTRACRPSRPSHDEPSLLGSVGKLVRLALVALVLALVVPYVKSHFFGGSKGGSGVVGKNTTVDGRGKSLYHHQQRQGERGRGETRERDEVDVFNFSHQDYLATRDKSARKAGVVASASPTAVISKPAQSPKQKQQKGASRSNSKARPNYRYNDDDDDDEDDGDDNGDHSPLPSSSSASLALRLLTAIPSTLLLTLRFLTVPIHHLFHLLVSLSSSLYQFSRLTLSHILRPILHLLAPLTYLLSGVLFIFVYVPFNLLSAVVAELYPVYIFLGAATVVGLAMGVAAAGVLYLSAFIFVDRVPSVKRMQDEQDRGSPDERGYFDTSTGRGSYDSTMYTSPMLSPTTPYRPSNRGERMAYQGYSGVPGSSLRASVG